ncbi:LysM peptidoglycan-binding domain-containing protein [Pedobacter metabolipauper]|uniref:LysM repeat protein n=1 Tax=Pedobacter metabolipauper TaxID=425513 RepID=A0A4R6SWV1_9SPHI|nr:LysM peptidoglycan-binding domain-containing protein [Pedobacter metabolipauper]TDQ10974.1 LysM repeat protein [Pedobacter metabolipauper]
MYKLYIVSVFTAILSITAASAHTRDSIGVENNGGKKLVIHKVIAKDTYYSIARKYNVTPKDVMAFNDNKYLQIGVIVKVPTQVPFAAPPSVATSSTANTDASTTASNLIEHSVQKKENLNMLAEKYGTTVNEIKRLNNLNSINLQIGQILKIPVKNATQEVGDVPVNNPVAQTNVTEPVKTTVIEKSPKAVDKKEPLKPAVTEEFIVHTVASNETMYSIASRYKITMDQLKAKNNLTDNNLNVGQKLLIKGEYPAKPAYIPPLSTNTDTSSTLKDPSLRYPPSRYGLNQVDEKGTAIWISDPDLDPSKMLVLHRSAPIGTVMKITNPMSNRSTFAKVVGKFTENESTKDVIIVMTKAVADALGALDKRFYCNLTYGGQDNEQ